MECPQQEAQNNTNLVDCLSTGLQYIPTDRYVWVFCRVTGHPPPAQQHESEYDNEIWGSHSSQYNDYSLIELMPYSLVDKNRNSRGTGCLHLHVSHPKDWDWRWVGSPDMELTRLYDNNPRRWSSQYSSQWELDILYVHNMSHNLNSLNLCFYR